MRQSEIIYIPNQKASMRGLYYTVQEGGWRRAAVRLPGARHTPAGAACLLAGSSGGPHEPLMKTHKLQAPHAIDALEHASMKARDA
jgi:hypothetical protein